MYTSINKVNNGKIFLFILFFLLSVLVNSVTAYPTAEDIESLRQEAKLTTDSFFASSFELRMKYEYKGGHLNSNDKEKLFKLAEKAGDKLKVVIEKQQNLKNRIENYEGDDWDEKYGATGLWRKLARELFTSTLHKCEIDFYLAVCLEQPRQNKSLKDLLSKIDPANQMYDSKYLHLLKAKTLALLSKTDSAYVPLAKKEFKALKIRSDGTGAIAFKSGLEEIKFSSPADAGHLKRLTGDLARSEYSTDIELILQLAFVRRQYEADCFEHVVHIWPQTEKVLGEILLSEFSQQIANKQQLPSITVFEAELAAAEAWKRAEEYKETLSYLAEHEKFQTPLILYIAGIASTETPSKSIELLMKASTLRQLHQSDKLVISAEQIAKQAAQFAYNSFKANSIECGLVLNAFEHYNNISKGNTDKEIEYLYAVVLKDCGKPAKADEMLGKIAAETGDWQNRAMLDLIIQGTSQSDMNEERRSDLQGQLSNLISGTQDTDIRIEAIGIYCQLLIESNEKESVEKILDILTETDLLADTSLNVFKSKALWRMGKLEESLKSFVLAIEGDNCRWADNGLALLSEIIDRIDIYEENGNFAGIMVNCEKIAEFCRACLGGRQSSLYLAEVIIFAKNRRKSPAAQKLLTQLGQGLVDTVDLDLLRCQGRLAAAEGKFNKAAQLWANLRQIHKSQANITNGLGWKWWRAKYYELYYYAKAAKTQRAGIFHTIEVLQNSYSDIPSFWAKKLGLLKSELANSIK